MDVDYRMRVVERYPDGICAVDVTDFRGVTSRWILSKEKKPENKTKQIMNDTLVIYHKSDLDGISSREVAKLALSNRADYYGFEYGEDIPPLGSYKFVYLIDISLPKPIMEKYADKLVWIDHHASAIRSIPSSIGGLRIDGVAACRLAYQYFFGNRSATKQDYIDRKVKEPLSITLLGEFDIWDKHDPRTDLFQLGMQGLDKPDWGSLLQDLNPATEAYINSILKDGKSIWNYLEVINKQISNERGYDVVFEGLSFRALNTARSNSITFKDSLKDHHDGCASYYWNGNTKKWTFSFYGVPHKPTLDLSLIAVKYGGGGHKQACGCTMDKLPEVFGGNSGATDVCADPHNLVVAPKGYVQLQFEFEDSKLENAK